MRRAALLCGLMGLAACGAEAPAPSPTLPEPPPTLLGEVPTLELHAEAMPAPAPFEPPVLSGLQIAEIPDARHPSVSIEWVWEGSPYGRGQVEVYRDTELEDPIRAESRKYQGPISLRAPAPQVWVTPSVCTEDGTFYARARSQWRLDVHAEWESSEWTEPVSFTVERRAHKYRECRAPRRDGGSGGGGGGSGGGGGDPQTCSFFHFGSVWSGTNRCGSRSGGCPSPQELEQACIQETVTNIFGSDEDGEAYHCTGDICN